MANLVLSERQKLVLMTFAQQALFNPEIAANLVINPRPMLRSTRLTEEDIDHIASFLDSVDGLKRGGTSGDAGTSLGVDIHTIDDEVEKAVLTNNQVTILTEVLDDALISTTTLQTLFENPKVVLTAAGLTEDDLKNVANYIKIVQDVIEVDRNDDWIG